MNTRRTFLPDPAGIWGLIIFATLVAIGGKQALGDGDTLWHIKMGQVMLERGEILRHDIFSHTAYGQPWHAHEWLSEIIMALLHGWAGLPGVTIFYFALVGLTFTLLLKVASRLAGEGPPSVAMILALPCIYFHLLARPHIFTWLGAALTLYLIERDGHWPWLLIPLTALWANLHGGVLFGLFVQATFITGNLLDHIQIQTPRNLKSLWEKSKKPVFILNMCILAACLNPFGYQIYIFPFKVASPVFAQGIGEWRSPDFQELWFARVWVISILFMSIWLGKKLSWKWHLLSLFIVWQALGHARNLSIGALLLIPCFSILCRDLYSHIKFRRKTKPDQVELKLSPLSGPLLIILLFITLVGSIWANFGGFRENVQTFFLPPKKYLAVMEFLKSDYPDGNLLNDYEWGDYLLFGLDPPPKVFIDGRADMYGEEIFSDYQKMANFEKETDKLLDKYKIDWVIFPKDHVLIRYLRDCRNWQILYTDDAAEIVINKSQKRINK